MKLLFTFKSKNSAIVVTAIACWIVGISILSTIAIRTNFKEDKNNMSYSISKTIEAKTDNKIKTLTIDIFELIISCAFGHVKILEYANALLDSKFWALHLR